MNTNHHKIGAVLVIGGGIGGIQASLDLADAGFKVYLLDKKPSIGGVMAQLDKTFPTNDCSMCILAPKLVSAARHPNIELITCASLDNVAGKPGNFDVRIRKYPRFVDPEKCNACGICASKCPVKIIDRYNEGLCERKAIGIDYPQAVPATYYIDKEHCLYFTKHRCRLCEKFCTAKAINFDQQEEVVEIKVGAVIVGAGLERFDAHLKSMYGYGRYKNVLTSIELERILNASGPFQGHLCRPSDQREPEKIAFIQCVGSRDEKLGNTYCSSVCCVYAIKEAILIKEHNPRVDCSIFYLDMRTFGKGFERYLERAKKEYGIKFVRGRIGNVVELSENKNLFVQYENEAGELVKEDFELLILSVGLVPNSDIKVLAQKCGIEVAEWNFLKTAPFSITETTSLGVFVCGTVSAPKDIPESVTEASAAAGRVIELLKEARNTLIKEAVNTLEIDVSNQTPRIGVFVCHCGLNIAQVVDVKNVVEYAKTLPNVIYAEDNLYSCSDDTQNHIKEIIKRFNLNRVVVAACTPRTHEPLFQETIRNAGLNKYLLEFANIRDQCSWVHIEQDKATEKAKDLVRMACARAILLEPLPEMAVPVVHKALLIGGGVSGMNAGLSLAKQGYDVYLVEREQELGGNARSIKETISGKDVQGYLRELIEEVQSNPHINIFKGSEVVELSGYVGNYKSKIRTENGIKEFEHGIIVLANGAREYKPDEYLYGRNPNVITQREMEERLLERQTTESLNHKTIVMIQCVGSRDESHHYCSRICCQQAIKNALHLKEINPNCEVFIFYQDIRTYGLNEFYYRQAREKDVVFIRYTGDTKPVVIEEGGRLKIKFKELVLNEEVEMAVDLLVLSAGIVPNEDNQRIAQLFKVPLNEDGFFLEAHIKLRPVDFATDGIFLCGLAHSPKNIVESIAQAKGAATRAGLLLARDTIEVMPIIGVVDEDTCIGCGICEKLCPYQAHRLERTEKGYRSQIIPANCKGCGSCAASCPQQAITMKHFTNEQIVAMVEVI